MAPYRLTKPVLAALILVSSFSGVGHEGRPLASQLGLSASPLALRAATTTRGPRIVARLRGSLVEVRGGVAYTSEGRGVRAYDAHCLNWCSPLWVAPGYEGLEAVARGTAYVGRYRRIDAYSTRCGADGGRCVPAYRIPQVDPAPHGNEYWSKLLLGSPVVAGNETYVAAREVAEDSHHGGDGQGRVFAFPPTCSKRCVPVWRTTLLDGSVSVQSHGRRVYVASHDGLAVFPKGCETDGRTCQPIWTGPIDADGSNVVSQPVIGNGLVLVSVSHDSGGGDAQPSGVHVFTKRCGAPVCQPRRFIRSPMFSSSPQIVHRRVYVLADRGKQWAVARAFSAKCGRPGEACRVVWRGRLRQVGDDLTLTNAGPLVYYSTRGGYRSREHGVTAFPKRCRATLPGSDREPRSSCEPAWAFYPPGGLRSGPLLGPGGTLLVQGRKVLSALPRQCGDPCLPLWEWTAPSSMHIEHVAGRRVFLTKGGYPKDEARTLVLQVPR